MSVLPKYNILYNYEQRYWQDFLKKGEFEEQASVNQGEPSTRYGKT